MARKIISIVTIILFFCSLYGPIGLTIAQDQVEPAAPANTENTGIQSAQESGKISLDLKGMDIVEVVKMLAAKGSLNVVLGSDVKGKVTIFLKSVNLMDALDIILIANNLAYDRRGDIIYVMSQREYERMYGEKYAEKKDVMTFRLKYAKAMDVSKALNQMKTKVGKVIVDDASNTIVAIDNLTTLGQMSDAIQNLDIPTVTKIFELKYSRAADIKDKINDSLTKGLGTVQIDERTNKIAVTDIEKKVADIEKIVLAFDDRLQQVLIEAKILQITLDDHMKLGVDWDSVIKHMQKQLSLQSAFQLSSFSAFGPPGAQLLLGSLGGGDVNVMIQVLKTVGDTNLLSSPRITAVNNQEAKILIGTSQPYATNTITQSTAAATTGTNISFLDIGVKLFVTPTINKDGFITMKIRPEVSSTNSNYTYGVPATTIPIVQTTQAETSVCIKDGTTIVIGGLIKDERKKTVNKIPILGNLPLIKYAFSNTDDEIVKQELVIFLTPHIFSGEEDYTDPPKSPPIDEDKFTDPEKPTFERRDGVPIKPGMFRQPRKDKDAEEYVIPRPAGPVVAQTTNMPATTQEYYYTIKNKIIGNIAVPNSAKYDNVKGKVKMLFFLTPDGKVARGPEILESSNHLLDDIAIKAVKSAGSFSAFPQTMGKTERRFIMDLAFE